MPLSGLTIIGESINDSVPSTKKLFDAGDIDGILELARSQDEKGAAYIDVNVGPRPPEFMADMVEKIQAVTAKPLSIDTPDPAIAKAGLEAYDLGPGRRQEADPQFDQRPAGGHVRSVQGPALQADPAWSPRTWSKAGRSPATPPRKPSTRHGNWSRRSSPAAPGQPTTTASSTRALLRWAATRRGTSIGSSVRWS